MSKVRRIVPLGGYVHGTGNCLVRDTKIIGSEKRLVYDMLRSKDKTK